MAGRKTPPKPDLFALLLDKMGLAPAKKKKAKRRKSKRRPAPAEPAFGDALEAEAAPEDYGSLDGYGFEPLDAPFDAPFDDSYEAAAAAGYAPTPAGGSSGISLPGDSMFGASAAPRTDGKLFDGAALDSSLDDLFSGLESGVVPSAPAGPAAEPPVARPVGEVSKVVPFPSPASAPVAPEPEAIPEPIVEPMFDAEEAYAPPSDPILPPEPLESEPAAYAPSAAYTPLDGGTLPLATERLTLSHGQDLRAILRTVDRARGVAGSLLVGYDGLIITTTLTSDVDCEYIGAQACSLFANSSVQMQKMGRGELRRVLLETPGGVMLMTAADMGILVVVSQDGQTMDTAGVMAAVHGALGYV